MCIARGCTPCCSKTTIRYVDIWVLEGQHKLVFVSRARTSLCSITPHPLFRTRIKPQRKRTWTWTDTHTLTHDREQSGQTNELPFPSSPTEKMSSGTESRYDRTHIHTHEGLGPRMQHEEISVNKAHATGRNTNQRNSRLSQATINRPLLITRRSQKYSGYTCSPVNSTRTCAPSPTSPRALPTPPLAEGS